MSKIGFLTDSCSDIPQELADKYGIEVVGFPINLDGVEYMERKDFTNDQFYQMMRDAQGVPTTAAITQLQFCDIYARYADEGYTDLVYLSINAGGSSTYNNAVKAMELLEEERPGYTMKIQVIDSHTYSMPYGWYFCECARKVRNGGELAACVAELKQKLDCVEICLAAYSLKQMKKSGRVSRRCGRRPAGHPPHHQPECGRFQGREQGPRRRRRARSHDQMGGEPRRFDEGHALHGGLHVQHRQA